MVIKQILIVLILVFSCSVTWGMTPEEASEWKDSVKWEELNGIERMNEVIFLYIKRSQQEIKLLKDRIADLEQRWVNWAKATVADSNERISRWEALEKKLDN